MLFEIKTLGKIFKVVIVLCFSINLMGMTIEELGKINEVN